MFELEMEIGLWRDALVDGGTINSDEKLELESHLRESVVALSAKGLSEQEAFLVATNRLGQPAELQQEFVKNNAAAQWRCRLFWMLVGILGLRAVSSAVGAITTIIGAAMAANGFGATVSGVTIIVASVSLWIAVFAIGFRKRDRLSSSSERLPLRWVIALGAILLIAPIASAMGRIMQTRLVESSWFGEAALYSSAGGIALNVCIVSICFAALWKLNDRETLTTN